MSDNVEKKFNWLFVVQNFEIKSYQDSAARIEVVEPIVASNFVNQHNVLCFDRNYQEYYRELVSARISELVNKLRDKPVVVYGSGIHTEQHLSQFNQLNIVAIADRDKKLWGSQLAGLPIISPERMSAYANDIVISSKAYETSICLELADKFPELSLHSLYHKAEVDDEFFQNMYQSLVLELASNSYDIVFYCPTHPTDCLPAMYWQRLRQQVPYVKFVTLWWDYDEEGLHSPYLEFERDCLTWNDLCIENSNATRLLKMKQGIEPYQAHQHTEKVVFHPTIFDPKLFYYDQSEEKLYDIALFGSAVGERKQWISFLQNEFPDNFHHIGGVLHGEETLSIEDYAQALRQSRICINTQTYSAREQCKGKVREALACGVVLLEQDNQQTRSLLDEGEGVLYFNDADTLLKHISILLRNKNIRKAIELEGQKRWQKIGKANSWVEKILIKLY